MNRSVRSTCPFRIALIVGLLVACGGVEACAARVKLSRFDQSVAEVNVKARLNRIAALVEDSNAPNLIGRERWFELLEAHRPRIESARAHASFAEAVNALIEEAGVSHFHYYTDKNWFYWHLLSNFESGGPQTHVAHIGLFTEQIDGCWFVRGVFEDSPADGTKIRVGDELLTVDGLPFHPIDSFRGKEGQSTGVTLRRGPGLIYDINITPVKESLQRAMERAKLRSIRVIEHEGRRFAYLHSWSLLGSGDEFRRLVRLQDSVEGLLLDFRDGFGGTSNQATRFLLGARDREGGGSTRDHWVKPVVILTASGTRSAKEIVVDAVKRAGRAPLVGTSTPGSVVSVGALRRVGPDALLMLPGHRFELEGKPTEPDYHVERDIRYCGGADPQLDRAKEVLTDLVRQATVSE